MADRTDRPEQVDDPVLIAAARHALHDEELVAAFAVDGDAAEDAARAKALIERCATCRDLHADVVAIGSTIRAAGTAQAVGVVRQAPRDFRLTPMDAARLQPGNVFQRTVARLFAGAAMFGRPVGATLATFGLVGLLVGTLSLGQLQGGGAPTSESLGAAAPASTFDTFGSQPGASLTVDRANHGPIPTGDRQKEPVPPAAAGGTDSSLGSNTIPLLFAGSVLLLVLGVALLFTGFRHARAWRRARDRT